MGEPAKRTGTFVSYADRMVSGSYPPSRATPTGVNSEFAINTTPTPGTVSLGTGSTPDILSRMSSSRRSETQGNWSSNSSAFPACPTNPNMGTGALYSNIAADPSNTYGMNTSTQGQGYDMSSVTRIQNTGQNMDMFPELGMEAGFDPNNLFALGGMMDETLFDFPYSFDPNMEFY